MNVLFITYDFPYPTTSGGKNRAYNLLKHTAHDANIFLYSFVRNDYNTDSNDEIQKLGISKIRVFKRRSVRDILNIPKAILTDSSLFKTLYYEKQVLEDLLKIIKEEKIDIVHFESSYTGFYIGEKLSKTRVKLVLGTENIEFMLYKDYAKLTHKFYVKPLAYYLSQKLKKEELEMVSLADAVTTVTSDEAEILKQLTGKDCAIVKNGIECVEFQYQKPKADKKNILFVGNFSYFPNVDAVNFFYKKVFPKIRKDVTITIVGKKCNQVFKFDDERIIKKDFVTDIISEYRNADLLLFPIRIGGGTNFKVLEAMALGVPIVANPDRLSGLDAVSGEHFLAATEPEEYARQIERVYEDMDLRESLTQKARSLVESKYSWDIIGKDLLQVWEKVI